MICSHHAPRRVHLLHYDHQCADPSEPEDPKVRGLVPAPRGAVRAVVLDVEGQDGAAGLSALGVGVASPGMDPAPALLQPRGRDGTLIFER